MIENSLEVGPLTPQELEEVCEKLRQQGVAFSILKDEEAEKSELRNDFANLVKKTEFRVETYLGQIFYLRLQVEDFKKQEKLFAEYGFATTPKENPEELDSVSGTELNQIHEQATEQRNLQKIVAWSIVIVMASFIIAQIFSK